MKTNRLFLAALIVTILLFLPKRTLTQDLPYYLYDRDTGIPVSQFGTYIRAGEYAVEYLKRISNHFRFFVMIEGSEDEIALIPEIQWHISPHVFLKVNNGFALTSKATDFAPEIGLMISVFP